MTMVEIVARALCRVHNHGMPESQKEIGWEEWVVEARAAILSMLVPTEGMTNATLISGNYWYTRAMLLEKWATMITAALEEIDPNAD